MNYLRKKRSLLRVQYLDNRVQKVDTSKKVGQPHS